TIARMINVRRFNLTSRIRRTLRIVVWMAQCTTESAEPPALAQIESTQSLRRTGAMCNLLVAVRSVAAANFESDERTSAARDIGQETQRAGIVLEGQARLRVASLELPPRFRDRCDTTGRPELRGLRRCFGCVEPEGDERKERDDSEHRCLRKDFHDAISPLRIDLAFLCT